VASVPDELVVAVSHVSPIKAAVCLALGVDARSSWRMHLGLASITRIGRRPDATPYLLSFNETAHLARLA
jgi:broad specificity phosphatase PhoE